MRSVRSSEPSLPRTRFIGRPAYRRPEVAKSCDEFSGSWLCPTTRPRRAKRKNLLTFKCFWRYFKVLFPKKKKVISKIVFVKSFLVKWYLFSLFACASTQCHTTFAILDRIWVIPPPWQTRQWWTFLSPIIHEKNPVTASSHGALAALAQVCIVRWNEGGSSCLKQLWLEWLLLWKTTCRICRQRFFKRIV